MTHYADGTEAKVGDAVVGRFEGIEGLRAGVVTAIAEGAKDNPAAATVHFLEAWRKDAPAPAHALRVPGPTRAGRPHPDYEGLRLPGAPHDEIDLFACAAIAPVHELAPARAFFEEPPASEPADDEGEDASDEDLDDDDEDDEPPAAAASSPAPPTPTSREDRRAAKRAVKKPPAGGTPAEG